MSNENMEETREKSARNISQIEKVNRDVRRGAEGRIAVERFAPILKVPPAPEGVSGPFMAGFPALPWAFRSNYRKTI